jgi:Uma2 family endonuclease
MERMGDPALTPREHFTYRHYKTWPDEERWELIDGRAWAMSPAPMTRHQEIVARLFTDIRVFLKGKPCKAYDAPFDVLLPRGGEADDEVDSVVQPDISVFCDRSKITDRGARGAPDLVIEVLSPSTSRKDQKEKYDLYERSGVREYWVVDPAPWSVWVYRLDSEGRFDSGELRDRLGDLDPIDSTVLVGFSVDPTPLFADLD